MKALLLVDLQVEFLQAPGLQPARSWLVSQCEQWLGRARQQGWLVVHVHTQGQPGANPRMPHWLEPRCLPGSAGWQGVLDVAPGERVYYKGAFSPFVDTALEADLRAAGVTELVVAGLEMHACLRLTIQDASQRGFAVALAEGAWASHDPLLGAATFRYLRTRGVAVEPLEVRDFHLDPFSGAENFRYEQTDKSSLSGLIAELRPHQDARFGAPLRERLQARRAEVVDLLIRDIGKPRKAAQAEVDFSLALLDACENLCLQEGKQPLGRCALITPFNNPLGIPLGKLVPAWLCGNAVVWKPAPAAQRVSQWMLALFREAGIGPDRLQLVLGGAELSVALAAHASVDALSLSGGVLAGHQLAEICLARGIPYQAELGGNNAVLVGDREPTLEVAEEVVRAAFGFAGQRCTATRRFLCPRSQRARWLELLREASAALRGGDPADANTDIGPLISAESRRAVQASRQWAREQGAEVELPLGEPEQWTGPALLHGVEADFEVARYEVFGPQLSVLVYDDFAQGLKLVEDVPQGLVASLFSDSHEQWEAFCATVRCGTLKWNEATANVAADQAFGGWKASGFGPPEHGPGDQEFWSRWQTRRVKGRD